jgi:hypothetical protein
VTKSNEAIQKPSALHSTVSSNKIPFVTFQLNWLFKRISEYVLVSSLMVNGQIESDARTSSAADRPPG